MLDQMKSFIKSLSKEWLLFFIVFVATVCIFPAALFTVENYSKNTIDCASNDDCSSERTCLDLKCEDACRICGAHTSCHVSNHIPYCSCVHGFEGNPLTGCSPGQDTRVAVMECTTDDQCSQDLACKELRCEDPCPRVCGVNSVCNVIHHRPVCACNPGYAGDPFTSCHIIQEGPQQSPGYSTSIENKVYHVFLDEKLDFHKAMSKCLSLGMRLATINNKQEYDKLVEILLGMEDLSIYWTSGTDEEEYGRYIWASTGEPMTFTKWSNNEPNHTLRGGVMEHCVELILATGYKMNDQLCSYPNHYICEKC